MILKQISKGDNHYLKFERVIPRDHLCQVWILHRCFLPSLALFGQAVSEEKICLNSSQSETRIALGGNICWWNGTKWRNFIEDLT
jgi:hypothetical protein